MQKQNDQVGYVILQKQIHPRNLNFKTNLIMGSKCQLFSSSIWVLNLCHYCAWGILKSMTLPINCSSMEPMRVYYKMHGLDSEYPSPPATPHKKKKTWSFASSRNFNYVKTRWWINLSKLDSLDVMHTNMFSKEKHPGLEFRIPESKNYISKKHCRLLQNLMVVLAA